MDQLGTLAPSPFVAIRFGSPVFGSTRYRPASPETRESKTIRWPSGDHRGVPVWEWKLLNFTASLPSRFDTQISDDPERSDPKTIRLPSGDMSGCESSREVGNSSAVDVGPRLRRSARHRLIFT